MITVCPECGQEIHFGDWAFCPHGRGHGGDRLASIHPSERTVVLRNPRTGEIRFPPRNDLPVHPKYQAQGYERVELANVQAVREFERTSGRVHERSHYDPGSGRAEREMTAHVHGPEPVGLDE